MTKKLPKLPPIVGQWLEKTGIYQEQNIQYLRLKQAGLLRMKPNARWMSFQAQQIFHIDPPSSDWRARVKIIPGLYLHGHDQWQNGKGRMSMNLWRFIPVVRASGANIDQGAMVRFLAEMVWFPWAMLKPYITWQGMNELQAIAIFQYQGITVSGIYGFNLMGDVINFQAKRFYSQGKGGRMEDWFVEIDPASYQKFGNIRLPTRAKVSWLLPQGCFTWLKLVISAVNYIA